jgi:ankyrin repeat protein
MQREVLYFVDDNHLDKVESKVLDNKNDIFWKVKCFNGQQPSYKDIYESCFNVKNIDFLLKFGHYKLLLKTYPWNDKLANYALNDETFLKHYIDIFDYHGETLLTYLVSFGYRGLGEDAVEKLIKNGPNVNIQDYKGKTALFYVQDEHVAEILLKAGANPNIVDKDGDSILMRYHTNVGMLKKLIQYGVNINIQNNDGETPLINILKRKIAVIDVIELYIDAGADKNIRDKDGLMAIDYLTKNYNHCSESESYRRALKLLTT